MIKKEIVPRMKVRGILYDEKVVVGEGAAVKSAGIWVWHNYCHLVVVKFEI